MAGVGFSFLPTPSIRKANITYGFSLQPTEVTRMADSIEDGLGPTRDTGLTLPARRRREV